MNHRHKAFTLVECVLGLFVIAIVMTGCYLLTSCAGRISRQQLEQPVAWYQFLNKLESDHWRFSLLTVERSGRRMQLLSQSNGETYQLLVSGSGMIYLRKMKSPTSAKGYLPLYGPIESNGLVLKRLDERRVKVQVKRHGQALQEATLCFAPPMGTLPTQR
ncbi:prepilin-type N-terminal cleavage/methylation domain-containing protein [uncultured Limosilactobacillus sp.]|uniref:prepilin-type N-terminal cleavage/methylation domain-containing protein n=1 Tax=uncultured Limosilactobacillus sp. TaxID=2837629 RepID=UPI0025D51E3D|nr:prepilin-type N-terminal cleavage/methylation domain-containing protein [uncultured Limosilactobacillus sp.]